MKKLFIGAALALACMITSPAAALTLCTGAADQPYAAAGEMIRAEAKGAGLIVDVVKDTGGTWGNIQLSLQGKCDAFVGQPDGLAYLKRTEPANAAKFVPVADLHREYLHVDEAQHLLRHSRSRAILDVQDRLKSLMQIEDWPLHTIYSGMPELAELLTGDRQLANRSMVMRFIPLSLPGDKASIAQVLADIVEDKCGLHLTDELRTDDFLGRLCTANSGCYGKIIEAVQAACFLVMHKGKGTVDRRAFAHNYQRDTGCLPSDNVFTAARWSEIDPGNALADLATAGKGGK